MPTTTVSSPINPTSSVTAQVSDDTITVITTTTAASTTTQNHDTSMPASVTDLTQLSSPTSNGDDSDDIIKAAVNGGVKNGAISSLLSTDASPKIALLSPVTDIDLNLKTSDMSCLNVVTTLPSVSSSSPGVGAVASNHFLNGSNGHLLMAQGSNFQATPSPTAPIESPWSIGDDNISAGGGFANYSSPNNGQLHKRMQHGLSPNSSIARNNSQQFVHYNKNNSTNFSSPWTNHSNNTPWQQQQQQQQPQQQFLQSTSSSSSSSSQMPGNLWNRGRSVPNLNPLSPHMMHQQRKHQNPTQYSMPSSASTLQHQQQQPHHQHHAPLQGLSPNLSSPSKYRRSTSYPGKNQMHAFQMDAGIGSMIEDQQAYMNYQVSLISF
jgi:hypothetical protein